VTTYECKTVHTAMADDSVWPWPRARATPCSPPGQAGVNATGCYTKPAMEKLWMK